MKTPFRPPSLTASAIACCMGATELTHLPSAQAQAAAVTSRLPSGPRRPRIPQAPQDDQIALRLPHP
ncbi:hypothetical protein GCM10022224_026500 [Nonomuraea antimicrobica]|uniref:Uncharacterized protein n=1 Tax=Nonomuraea antimicrobica TaxID=561173 RepID=A0ABP7BL47_9ACTN